MHNPLEDKVPDDPIQRVHALAKDLAYAVSDNLCSAEIGIDRIGGGQMEWRDTEGGQYLSFLDEKWRDHFPYPSLLIAFEYFAPVPNPGGSTELYRLTSKAFSLLEQPTPASIFISYSRRESSAFALLILARFKAIDLEPFLDIRSLQPGDDWHAELEHEVRQRENFICLIGPHTLESPYVRKEIKWALDAGVRTIPIWHNGFHYDESINPVPETEIFLKRHAIIVEKEDAKAYQSALDELLNYFGVTPT